MRGALLVVVGLLLTGCATRSEMRAYDATRLIYHPTMTTEDVATANELQVQHTVEGTSRGLK